MNENNKFVRFDWAAKRMLRDKANFGVIEGLLTVLIGEKITIEQMLESESNQNARDDKFNRVDIKALNSKGEIIIVEIQLTRQLYYLERILFGVSKAITEHITLGSKYDNVKNIYNHLDELTPKQREAFVEAKGHIEMSHELVTIKTDIVLDVDSRAMELTGTYSPEAADLFEKYEFGSLRRFLGTVQPSAPKEAKKVEFSETAPAQVIKEAQKLGRCAIITESCSEGIFSDIARVTVAAGTLTAEGKAEEMIAHSMRLLVSPVECSF